MISSAAAGNSAAPVPGIAPDVVDRARSIRLLACDVDGVLTDGKLHFHQQDGGVHEGKSFSILDGLGIKLLQESGVIVALITGRRSDIVTRRAAEMGVTHVVQGADDKQRAWQDLLRELDLPAEATAYIGDDWPDLPVIRACGLGVTVPGAPALLRQHARHVTRATGGNGAVREVCELIMEAQGTLQARLQRWL